MRQIPLNGARGGVALVDDEDYARIAAYQWHQGTAGYVESSYRVSGKTVTVRMHRVVMGPLPRIVVDHRNGNRLDNRRDNLRIATQEVNCWNMHAPTRNKAGCAGVHMARSGRWVARIIVHGRVYHLGTFDAPADAGAAYAAAKTARNSAIQ